MAYHLVAYVQQRLITAWKGLTLKFPEKEAKKEKPAFLYGSNDSSVFGKYAKTGSVLWVVGSVPDHSPSLVARLKIKGRLCEDIRPSKLETELLKHFGYYCHVVQGDPEQSKFYPHNDVARALLKTELGKGWPPESAGSNKSTWTSKCGSYFRRPHLIRNTGKETELGAKRLCDFADNIKARSVFISWKHQDFWPDQVAIIHAFVNALVERKFGVWWDQLVLPGPEGQRELYRNPPLMGQLLRKGLHDSQILITISSAHYGMQTKGSRRNWTLEEWDYKPQPGTKSIRLKRVIYPLGGAAEAIKENNADHVLPHKAPVKAAVEFKRWFDKKS